VMVLEADVVIVGFGAAGAAAALAAAERGASVLILEKQAEDAHTPNTKMSGGLIMGVSDVEAATRYLRRCGGGMISDAVCAAWARRASELVAWLDRQGTELRLGRIFGAEHPDFEGAEGVDVLQIGGTLPSEAVGVVAAGFGPGREEQRRGRTGLALFAALAEAAAARPEIDVRWSTPARRLVQDAGGAVTGVLAGDGVEARARHGVILACGGYEFDDELRANYLKAWPIHFYGNPDNTGDGIRMALAVGADLWHMNQMVGRAIGHFERPEGGSLNVALRLDPPGYLILDKHGRRYANEHAQARMDHAFYYEMLTYDSAARDYPRIPSYWLFDERRRSAGPLVSTTSGAVGVGLYDWSRDNRREIEAGWIAEGATVEEAAERAGVRDPGAAAQTVTEYNAGCGRGDDPLGRPAETLVPLDRPPFYCVPMFPGGSNTSGGPRRDEHARVLDAFGSPIPGLYGAGELGQAIGLLYPAHGANLSEALCSGRIAAESALGVANRDQSEEQLWRSSIEA
jgi:succinate dehydrogenase/fumarate reductase flavoprotein subunit